MPNREPDTRGERGYELTVLLADSTTSIAISDAEYLRLLHARNGLFAMLNVEEKFDLLMETHVELESSLLQMALHFSPFSGQGRETADGDRRTANRRTSNLLSTARLYIDQTSHELASLEG